MRYITLVMLIAIIPFLNSCTKTKKEDLSKPSQEGKDILWCKIDGAEHKYQGKPSTKNYGVNIRPIIGFSNGITGVSISARNVEYDDDFHIFVITTSEPGEQPQLNKKYPMATKVPNSWVSVLYWQLK